MTTEVEAAESATQLSGGEQDAEVFTPPPIKNHSPRARAPRIADAAEKSSSVVSPGDETESATASSTGLPEMPDTIPGLTSGNESGAAPSAFEIRQQELNQARANSARKGGKLSPKEKLAKARADAKLKAEQIKAKERERIEREKTKLREKEAALKAASKQKTAAQLEKASQKLAAKKDSQTARQKEAEERKARKAAAAVEAARVRAAAANPDILARETRGVKELFAEMYRIAGPKTDRTPDGLGVRRAKSDRGDFAAGFVMLLRFLRSQGVKLPTKGTNTVGEADPSEDADPVGELEQAG